MSQLLFAGYSPEQLRTAFFIHNLLVRYELRDPQTLESLDAEFGTGTYKMVYSDLDKNGCNQAFVDMSWQRNIMCLAETWFQKTIWPSLSAVFLGDDDVVGKAMTANAKYLDLDDQDCEVWRWLAYELGELHASRAPR